MVAACPGDRGARDADGQYLIGTDLLAAPVTSADGEQDVYLPAGAWIDYATRDSLRRRPVARLTRPPEQAPLFVRHGALLPVDASAPAQRGRGPGRGADPGGVGRERRHHHRDEDRGETRIALTVTSGAAELTVTGPAPLTRAEWPRLPGRGPAPPGRGQRQRWTVNESDPNRMIATPVS